MSVSLDAILDTILPGILLCGMIVEKSQTSEQKPPSCEIKVNDHPADQVRSLRSLNGRHNRLTQRPPLASIFGLPH